MFDFVLKELNQVTSNCFRCGVCWSIGLGLILIIRLDDCNDLLWIHWNRSGTDPIFGSHNEVRFSVGWKLRHCDIVKTFKGWRSCVDFNDNLVSVSLLYIQKFKRGLRIEESKCRAGPTTT